MKTVVFACLGTLLTILSLGFGHEASGTSNEELFDNVDQVRSVRGTSDKPTPTEIMEGGEFSHTCPPHTRFGAFKATWGLNHCFWDVSIRVHYQCFGKMRCKFPVTNHFFGGDPCRLQYKYFHLQYKCWPKAQLDALQPVHTHQNYEMTLHCPPNETISIVLAEYGYGICTKDAKETMTELCAGKRVCTVKATDDHFGDSCPKKWKMLDVYYRCDVLMKENKRCWPKVAERRRLIKSPRIYEGHEITLRCPLDTKFGVVDVYYGTGRCNVVGLGNVDEVCFGKTSCKVAATNDFFDQWGHCPARLKHLDVKYGCWPRGARLRKIRAMKTWEHYTMKLSCPSNEKMEVVWAYYGYGDLLCYNTWDVFKAVDDWCSGKQICMFQVENDFFKVGDPCVAIKKYAIATYRCWPNEYWAC